MDLQEINLWVAFTAGILSFFSPCVIPLVPSYIVYITGLSFAELKNEQSAKTRLVATLHSLSFVVGFSIVFVVMGAMAGMASEARETLQGAIDIAVRFAGVLVVIFGLHLTGIFRLNFLLGEKRIHISKKPTGVIGTVVVGMAFAAGWTPCIGPILGSILTMAANTDNGTATTGAIMLTSFSFGIGIPFIVSALLFERFLSFFQKFKKYIRMVEIASGVLLIAMGALIAADKFSMLGNYIMRLYY